MSLILDGNLGVTVDAGTAALPAVVSATGTADTGLWFPAADTVAASTAGTERLRIDSSGNVLIGTTTPRQLLTIAQNNSAGMGMDVNNSSTASNTTKTTGLFFSGTDTVGTYKYAGGFVVAPADHNYVGSQMQFYTRGSDATTERMRIDAVGNVLVGTTIASGKMTMSWPSASQQGLVLNAQDVAFVGSPVVFYNSVGGVSGFIGQTTSTVSYGTSSDYRLKNTIAPMTGALDKVALLKPVTYKWNVDGADGQGFIAHELQAVVPDCVVGEKDAVNADGSIKPQGIDTSFLVATLTASIQELKAIIDTQAAQIAALNAKVGI